MELKINSKIYEKRGLTNLSKLHFTFFSIIILSLFYFPVSFPQSNEDCLACHEDNTLTTERKGKEVSLYVDTKVLSKFPASKIILRIMSCGF